MVQIIKILSKAVFTYSTPVSGPGIPHHQIIIRNIHFTLGIFGPGN